MGTPKRLKGRHTNSVAAQEPVIVSLPAERELREAGARLQPEAVHAFGERMSEDDLNGASITVNQDGIKSFFSALINPQHYEIFIDNQKAGELTGYTTRSTSQLAPGRHSIYVRVYARDSVSVTRVYGYSQTLDVELSPGERKSFSCGLLPGPPLRKWLIFGGLLITLVLALAPMPPGLLTPRARYALVMAMALMTIAFSWYGYSSKPGANIYLKEA